jgi:kynureninase
MDTLREKSVRLTGYLESLVSQLGSDRVSIVTPSDPEQRGCQLSIRVKDGDRSLQRSLTERGVFCDWREPDVIRVAPTPLYNSFEDVYRFSEILRECLM